MFEQKMAAFFSLRIKSIEIVEYFTSLYRSRVDWEQPSLNQLTQHILWRRLIACKSAHFLFTNIHLKEKSRLVGYKINKNIRYCFSWFEYGHFPDFHQILRFFHRMDYFLITYDIIIFFSGNLSGFWIFLFFSNSSPFGGL